VGQRKKSLTKNVTLAIDEKPLSYRYAVQVRRKEGAAMTTTTTWTDRYLSAILKGIPVDQRSAVDAELRQAIDTSVSERMAQGEDPQTAEQIVLRGLGDPMRVSATYSGRSLSLIGPNFYPEYIRLLRLLVSIVVPIVTVVVGIMTALSGESLWSVVLAAVGSGFMVGIQIAFWVTLVFAVLDRRTTDGSAVTSEWDLDDLPELTDNRIGLGDTLASITGLSLLVLFLLWQPTYQESLDPGGPAIPILNPELSTLWIPVLIVILLASITLELIKYRAGRWNVPLAVVNTLLSFSFAFSAIFIISSDQLLNPEFTAVITAGAFGTFVDLFPTIIAWVIAVVAIFDVTEGWWKALRGRA
jgi:hypothetical protein